MFTMVLRFKGEDIDQDTQRVSMDSYIHNGNNFGKLSLEALKKEVEIIWNNADGRYMVTLLKQRGNGHKVLPDILPIAMSQAYSSNQCILSNITAVNGTPIEDPSYDYRVSMYIKTVSSKACSDSVDPEKVILTVWLPSIRT